MLRWKETSSLSSKLDVSLVPCLPSTSPTSLVVNERSSWRTSSVSLQLQAHHIGIHQTNTNAVIVGSIIQTTCALGAGNDLAQLYVGRVIGGFGVGLTSAVVPTYIGENANKEIRGRCIGCMQLFNVTGICLSFFVNYGASLHMSSSDPGQWRMPFALQILPGAILLVGLCFTNESPRWLVEKNRIDEARKALSTVRSRPIDDPEVDKELEEIVKDFRGHEKLPLTQQVKMTFSDSKVLYTFFMAVSLMFWQQWTGTNR